MIESFSKIWNNINRADKLYSEEEVRHTTKRRKNSRSNISPTNFTAEMQSSLEIQLPDRCRPMSSTASDMKEVGPSDSEEMARIQSSNMLSSPEQVRRRVSGKSSADGTPRICRQQSFGRDIGHAAAETYLITRLSFNLLGYLGYWFRFFPKFGMVSLICSYDCNLLDRESQDKLKFSLVKQFDCHSWSIDFCFQSSWIVFCMKSLW